MRIILLLLLLCNLHWRRVALGAGEDEVNQGRRRVRADRIWWRNSMHACCTGVSSNHSGAEDDAQELLPPLDLWWPLHQYYGLPVVLGRGRPFLGSAVSTPGISRSVCPQGRLLAVVSGRGAVTVYSLTRDTSGRECVVSSDSFSRLGQRLSILPRPMASYSILRLTDLLQY